MKGVLSILSLLAFLFVIPMAQAAKQGVTKSCTYKCLTCMDNCEYYQDQQKINPCYNSCYNKYRCCPKRRIEPMDHVDSQHDDGNAHY